MAAGNDLEVAVAECEAIGIVENLDVVLVALGEVDGVFVLPVVVVLVKGNGAYAARGEIEGGSGRSGSWGRWWLAAAR